MTGTKFEHLGNLPVPASKKIEEVRQKCMDGVSLGELSPCFFKKHLLGWVEPLRNLIREKGLVPTSWFDFDASKIEDYYPDIVFLPVRGSSGWHKDYEPENALTLSWLIHCEPLISPGLDGNYSSPHPTLIVKYPQDTVVREIMVGDVFVFDHQYHHVWVSNWQYVLVQMPLSLTSCS